MPRKFKVNRYWESYFVGFFLLRSVDQVAFGSEETQNSAHGAAAS